LFARRLECDSVHSLIPSRYIVRALDAGDVARQSRQRSSARGQILKASLLSNSSASFVHALAK
jgi:hypothetical protein